MISVFVIVRVSLHLAPNSNFNVAGYNIHHLYTGILLLVVAAIPLALRVGEGKIQIALTLVFGAGIALILDEWVYLITTNGSDDSYLLPISLWGALIMVGLASVYVFVLGRR